MNSITRTIVVVSGLIAALVFSVPVSVHAQSDPEICGYALVERTVYDQTPVTVTMQVNETVMQRQSVTTQRPVYRTEMRQRTRSVLKPVIRTTERTATETVLRPVVETVMEDRVVDKTVYETITEMEDRMFVVEEPATETVMQEREVLVRRPVTRQVMQTRDVTAYKPVTVQELRQVPGSLELQQLSVVPGSGRWCRQWLAGGYYTDPVSGLSVYRKRGFHWVRQGDEYALSTTSVPVLTQQPVNRTALVPETVQVREPVELTTMEDVYETRRVPIEVETTRQRIETRKVPVERQVERTIQVTERVPVERTRYVEETVTRTIPEREMVYETVEYKEDYEQPVTEWVDVTQEIEVPVVVPKDVEVELIKHTPRTIMMRIPLDRDGNPIGPAEPVENIGVSTARYGSSERYGDAISAANAAIERQVVKRAPTLAPGEWQSAQNEVQSGTRGNRPVTSLGAPQDIRLDETGYEPRSAENGAVSILENDDEQADDAGTRNERSEDGRQNGTDDRADNEGDETFVEFRARPTPTDPTAINVPETNAAGRFDNEPRTQMTEVWRPPIPGRPEVESQEQTGRDEDRDERRNREDDASGDTNDEAVDPVAARRPVFPPGTETPDAAVADESADNTTNAADENADDEGNEPAPRREAEPVRTGGGTSISDRFPNAEVVDETSDAADRAPAIDRRED